MTTDMPDLLADEVWTTEELGKLVDVLIHAQRALTIALERPCASEREVERLLDFRNAARQEVLDVVVRDAFPAMPDADGNPLEAA